MIEGEIARGLVQERLQVGHRALAGRLGDTQIGVVGEIFRSVQAAHHTVQRADQRAPLGLEYLSQKVALAVRRHVGPAGGMIGAALSVSAQLRLIIIIFRAGPE